jgi:hypothetical protein
MHCCGIGSTKSLRFVVKKVLSNLNKKLQGLLSQEQIIQINYLNYYMYAIICTLNAVCWVSEDEKN